MTVGRIGKGRILLAAGILAHLLMFSSLATGWMNFLFDDAVHRRGQGVDFFSVYQAGQNIVDGVSVYAPKPETVVVPYWYPYRYHPFTAFTFGLAFQVLTPAAAYALWILLNELLLLINIALTRRLFTNPDRGEQAAALWLLFTPLYLELFMGQFSFLMASLMFWTLLAWTSNRTMTGDSFWIASVMVKSNSALFAPVLIRFGRWKPVVVGGCFVLVCSVPYFVLVPGSFEAFAANVTEGMKVPSLAGNQGFAALVGISVLRLGGFWPDSIFGVHARLGELNEILLPPTLVTVAVVGLIGLYFTVRLRQDSFIDLCLLWMLVYVLLYKHVWEHQYVMILPVFILLLAAQEQGRHRFSRVLWGSYIVLALPTLFAFVDKAQVLVDPEYYWTTAESLLVHAPKPLAALLLFAALGASLGKRLRGGKG